MVKFVVNGGFEHRYSPVTWDDVGWWTLNLLITGQEVREGIVHTDPACRSAVASSHSSHDGGSSDSKGLLTGGRAAETEEKSGSLPGHVVCRSSAFLTTPWDSRLHPLSTFAAVAEWCVSGAAVSLRRGALKGVRRIARLKPT